MRDRRKSERAGRQAEKIAAWLLRFEGYRIIAERYASPVGEIDLIAARGSLLVFVEVKRRRSREAALSSLGPTQQRRIARAAEAFLAENPPLRAHECRFDVIAIGGFWPHHVEDAWRV